MFKQRLYFAVAVIATTTLLLGLYIAINNDNSNNESDQQAESELYRQNTLSETQDDADIESITDPTERYSAYVSKANTLLYDGDSSAYDVYIKAYKVEDIELQAREQMLYGVYTNARSEGDSPNAEKIESVLTTTTIERLQATLISIDEGEE